MLLCGHQHSMEASAVASYDEVGWTYAAKQYDNVGEMPSFVAQTASMQWSLIVNVSMTFDSLFNLQVQ